MIFANKTMGRLTTHVLDTANGKPAKGLVIKLFKIEAEQSTLLKSVVTNDDGRVDTPMLEGRSFKEGIYELVFNVGDYYDHSKSVLFLGEVPVRFSITNAREHYHIPLLVSPFGYSTYRGS